MSVTVYIPSHNYGKFLEQAIQSVFDQIFANWELILINDGSTDETESIIRKYSEQYPDRILPVHNMRPRGLQWCSNKAIELSRGEYIIRLDADDFFDESALLVLTAYLDNNPEVALVYPNFYYISQTGEILEIENRKKIHQEARLLDLPAHGACTLMRKSMLIRLGGYSLRYDAQDGYEIWLKALNSYAVGNVATPLFYYRQHPSSVSRDEGRILRARQKIKNDAALRKDDGAGCKIAGIIPVKNSYPELPNIAFERFNGLPLIDYTVAPAIEAGLFDCICITTDDEAVIRHCAARYPQVKTLLRPQALSDLQVNLKEVIRHAVVHLERNDHFYPDIITVLSIHSPLRRPEHILEAVHTLRLFDTDSVISVYEDRDLHFIHDAFGLKPINKGMMRQIRLEREGLYVENGAIKAFKRSALDDDMYGQKVGHIVMAREDSLQIKSPFDRGLIDFVIRNRRTPWDGLKN